MRCSTNQPIFNWQVCQCYLKIIIRLGSLDNSDSMIKCAKAGWYIVNIFYGIVGHNNNS